MTRLRVRPGLSIRTLPDGDAVVARAGGSDAIIVNSSAHAILELLAHEGTEQEVIAAFHDSFPDVEERALTADITALIARLVRDGILEPCGSAPSTA